MPSKKDEERDKDYDESELERYLHGGTDSPLAFPGEETQEPKLPRSKEYKKFREEEEYQRSLSFFEKLYRFAGRFPQLKCPEFIEEKIGTAIFMSDLRTNKDEVFSASVYLPLLSILALIPLFFLLGFPLSLVLLLIPGFLAYNLISYPTFYADVIRIKAGNEMVKAILYMVIYLSSNPVFVNSIRYASKRILGPIGRDFKKIFWDIKMRKYSTVEEALSTYSSKWVLWNEKFVRCLGILKSIEKSKESRGSVTRKALEEILEGTFEQMEQYAKDLRTPSKLLHSFGILLPVLGLIMFPLISIFMSNSINPAFLMLGYNIILPAFLYWFMHRIVSKRPSAFSHSKRGERVEPKEYISLGDKFEIPIGLTAVLLGILIMVPAIINFSSLYTQYSDLRAQYPGSEFKQRWAEFTAQRYSTVPMLKNMFIASFLPWGMAVSILFYTFMRSHDKKEIEDRIREMEENFETFLFELGKSLEENIPVGTAIGKVLQELRKEDLDDTPTFNFFQEVRANMTNFSMTFREALFDEENGVMEELPSSIIKDVLRALTNALKKSPSIASRTSKDIVNYLNRTREIEKKVKNLLDDVISSLNMQASFIAPFISAVVSSMAVIIVQFLQQITVSLQKIEEMFNIGGPIQGATSGMSSVLGLINIGEIVPPTVLQVIVGVYMIEIVVVISVFLNGIEKGFDEVYRDVTIYKNLSKAILLYSVVMFLAVIFFQPVIQQVGGIGA